MSNLMSDSSLKEDQEHLIVYFKLYLVQFPSPLTLLQTSAVLVLVGAVQVMQT